MENLQLFYHKTELGQIVFADANHFDQLINYQADSVRAAVNQKFYSEFYSAKENPLKVTRAIQYTKLASIMKLFLDSSKKTVLLDVGCGQGDFVQLLQEKHLDSFEPYGIEPSIAKETDRVKKLSLDDIHNSLILPKNYDAISLLDVFEHFPKPVDTLSYIWNLLKEDGLLVLMVPNKDSLLYRTGKLMLSIYPSLAQKIFSRLYQITYPPPHYFYYNANSLKALIAPHFDVIYVGYQSQLPFSGIPTRLWGVNRTLKPLLIIGAIFYRLLSPFSLNDSLVVIARKKQTPNRNKPL